MRLKRASYFVMIIVFLSFISFGFIIYLRNSSVPVFNLRDIEFKLGEEERSIEFYVSVVKGNIKLRQLFINNLEIYKWKADKDMIVEGEEVKCFVEYDWKMGERYSLKLVTAEGYFVEAHAESPLVMPSLTININKIDVLINRDLLKIKADYEVDGVGVDTVHLLLFTYSSFKDLNRTIYIFYDPEYMTDESIKRADAIVRYFKRFGVEIYRIDYYALELWSRQISPSARRSLLIIINPLKDSIGRGIQNAIPAPIMDPNGNGILKDDSRYGRSYLYDLMRDDGLVLVSVGSLQPHKKILYKDGVYSWARDSSEPFDVHLFLTNASGREPIVRQLPFIHFHYTPVRISGTLGLSYIETSMGFEKDAMERHGLEYYAYGDYRPSIGSPLNLTLPVFIRVGKGGWLAMGDEELWLNEEQLAHNLFMIYMQAIWDSDWIPYGWYWDSGCSFYSSHGTLKTNGKLETEFIPVNIIGEKVILRIVGIAYVPDFDEGIIVEKIIEYDIKKETAK